MAKVEDRPGFETFGEDVLSAREAWGLTIKALAEQVYVDPRYPSEIEWKPAIPSIPVMLRLARTCLLPIDPISALNLLGRTAPAAGCFFHVEMRSFGQRLFVCTHIAPADDMQEKQLIISFIGVYYL